MLSDWSREVNKAKNDCGTDGLVPTCGDKTLFRNLYSGLANC
jgi:hypothetical protein